VKITLDTTVSSDNIRHINQSEVIMKVQNTFHNGNSYRRLTSADFKDERDVHPLVMCVGVALFALVVAWMILQ